MLVNYQLSAKMGGVIHVIEVGLQSGYDDIATAVFLFFWWRGTVGMYGTKEFKAGTYCNTGCGVWGYLRVLTAS
jgi:hypothetical protein